MKVKSCYMAKWIDSEEEVKEYTEELGCTIRHCFSPKDGFITYTIEDATGNQSVLVVMPREYRTALSCSCGLRVVVDNIQEGIEFYKAKGYKIIEEPLETESNHICFMNNDTEYRLIFEHKKHAKKLNEEELKNVSGGGRGTVKTKP